jgi:hypothetical protein
LGCSAECPFGRSSAGWECRPHWRCRTNSGAGCYDSLAKYDASTYRLCEPADWLDAVHSSGFEFDETGDAGQQHTAFYGKSEQFQCSWDHTQRVTVRNDAGDGGNAQRIGTERGIVKLGFV